MDKSQYLPKISGHVLVFGAGGIGAEIIRALIAYGATSVTFTYNKNQAAAEALKSEIEALGIRAFIGSVDLMDTESLATFLDKATEAMGEEITTVVNTVGISPNTPLAEQTPEEWREVYEVNVFGSFFSSRLVASRMKERGLKGSITLITSTNGINSQSSISAHYDSSKAAQSHMMRILAEEYAPAGIRINGVAPGWINTKMNDTLPEDERAKEMAKIWSGRFAEPSEVATLVAFVASSGGSNILGQDLMTDGGYR
jgi:NAD(P)-dependent dehydrogenase (short-subunit alcohol dehydrogenase family)